MLRLAIQAGSTMAILARLRHGDAVHSRDTEGRTPLMLAALRGHVNACRALLDHEADALARDHQGRTALELAKHEGHTAVVEMLSECSGALVETPFPAEQHDAADPRVQDSNAWEPESLEPEPAHEESCVSSAALLQASIRAHAVVDRDEDWGDVDVDLPLPVAGGGRVALDDQTRAILRKVFAEALDAGWINPDQVLEFLCGIQGQASEHEFEIGRKSIQRLADQGVDADVESWWSFDPGGTTEDNGTSDEIEAMLADVEDSVSPRHDPLWSFARDLRLAGPLLDHDGEIRLGSELQGGIQSAVLALCCDPHAAAVMLKALEDRVLVRQVGPEASNGIASYLDQSDGLQPDGPDELDAIKVDGLDQLSIDSPALDLVRSAAATLASLRLAVEKQFSPSMPSVGSDLQELVRDSVACTGLGIVHLFELSEHLAPDKVSSSAREAFSEGLRAAMIARDRLVRSNLRLVWSIARKYAFSGIPLLDLIQEGSIGLMRAVDRYDHTRGFRFSTYATWWIRQTVSRSVADTARLIRVPVHIFERIRNVERATVNMRLRLGRNPLEVEIAAELGLTESEVKKALSVPQEPSSTDDPSNADWPERLDASFTDSVSPEEKLALAQLQDWVASTVDSLKPKDALILRMRYGLGTDHEHTLEEVGRAMELTRERIRQIEKKAMNLLKQRFERDAAVLEPRKVQGYFEAEELEENRQILPTARLARETVANFTEVVLPLPNATLIEPAMAITSRPVNAVVHVLKLLASPQMQRGIAAALDAPSFQREFAHRWFQAYDAVDPDGNFTAMEHGELQRVSSELRKALRLLGFGRIEIGDLLRDPGWQDVTAAASSALIHLKNKGQRPFQAG